MVEWIFASILVISILILQVIGFISVFLVVGFLFYSLTTGNWQIWKKLKYIGYALLIVIGIMIISLIGSSLI